MKRSTWVKTKQMQIISSHIYLCRKTSKCTNALATTIAYSLTLNYKKNLYPCNLVIFEIAFYLVNCGGHKSVTAEDARATDAKNAECEFPADAKGRRHRPRNQSAFADTHSDRPVPDFKFPALQKRI